MSEKTDEKDAKAKAAADAKAKAAADAKAKADAEAKTKADAEAAKPTLVRVIYKKGVLGYLGLKEGDETDDPAYVDLLKEKGQRDVELVK